uniref:SDR family oxidoreductase n=1 Tax=Flavobacterium sp. TaxID=239 RepID=UPI00404B504B
MTTKSGIVLITGGNSGIGLEIAKLMDKKGYSVIITGTNQEKLNNVKAENPALTIFKSDVTKEDDIVFLAKSIERDFGGIDVLINNAGILEAFDLGKETHTLERQFKEIAINFNAPIAMVHHFLPQLKKSKNAVIVNVSSSLAYVPFTQTPVYSGTKAAVHAWTKSIRLHLKPWNIKVLELLPPLVATPLEKNAKITGNSVKLMQPEDLAKAFWIGFQKNQEEITPGIATMLKIMSRLAPKFIFKQLNKVPIPQ